MIVSAEKVLSGSGMGPVGEDSAAPQQRTSDPDAGWKGGRPRCARLKFREPEDHKRKQGQMFKTVPFASLMDICHLKNSKLEPKIQKYKGRVVLRGGTVQDDSGSDAVITEQGSSS